MIESHTTIGRNIPHRTTNYHVPCPLNGDDCKSVEHEQYFGGHMLKRQGSSGGNYAEELPVLN